MVHISKQTLEIVEQQKLFAELNRTIGNLNSSQSALFLNDFLGPEEQVLLAKRLAAILMLSHNQSIYKVASTLHISTSTASDFYSKLTLGRYNQLLSVIRKNKNGYIKLLSTIDSILHLGGVLPHYGQTHSSEAYRRKHAEKPFD